VPGHSLNIDAIVLNTAGVALACLLVFPPVRAWLRRKAGHPAPWSGTGHEAEAYGALHQRNDAGACASPRTARVGMAP
jgi:hypothetical protein